MVPNFGAPPVLEPGSLVLVTGANGFIGSHIADQLIQAGYRVRGTARDASKVGWLKAMFDEKYGRGKFELAVVEDLAKSGAYDEACKGVSGVAHVAGIMSLDHDPNKVIPQNIAGVVSIAESAAKEPSVKRFVYTSSSTAITAPKPNEKFEISTKNWNDEDVEKAWKAPPYNPDRAWAVYAASKMLAEQAIWKYAKERKPAYIVNTVVPDVNFGEVLSDKQPAFTAAWVKTVFEGNLEAVKDIPPQWMVNVKDTARLHVSALTDPRVENERILAYAEPFNWNDVLAQLRRLYPGRSFPKDIAYAPRDLSTVDNSREAHLLQAYGRDGFTSLGESVKENTLGLKA